MCGLMGLNRSSYYHVPRVRTDDAELEQTLQKQAGKLPRDGYRRLTQTLRRRYKRYRTLNTKRVRRVMKQAGIQIQRRKKPRRTTNSQHAFQRYPNLVKNLTIDHPHQVWVGDIAAIVLADDTEVFLAILMDVFTRKIVGWELARDMCRWPPSNVRYARPVQKFIIPIKAFNTLRLNTLSHCSTRMSKSA
jgi:transposase InsO family protein